MLALGALGWPFFRFVQRIPEGDDYLQVLAVDEDLRGSGVGSLLIGHVERRALAAGARRLSLDVALGNQGARRLYVRRGLVEEAVSPSLYLSSGARVIRMVKDP